MGNFVIGRTRRSSLRLDRAEEGYVLLSLLLIVALLVVAAAAVLPSISFEIKRDREQELIHRGVQYSRAIRSYYKKFGRYPTRIEELESTNNLRFLRKRYKDPITGQDFKLLHFGEVKMAFNAPLAGASNINGTPSLNNPAGFGSQPQPGEGSVCAGFWFRDGSESDSQLQFIFIFIFGVVVGLHRPAGTTAGHDFQRQTFWSDIRWRAGGGSREHQQERQHPRIQSQEKIRRVAIHL